MAQIQTCSLENKFDADTVSQEKTNHSILPQAL